MLNEYQTRIHYGIGIGLAVPFVVGWDLILGGTPPPVWAVGYGLATTSASWLIVYPAFGFGIGGFRSPDGWKAPFSPIVNHLFFGLGLALGIGWM